MISTKQILLATAALWVMPILAADVPVEDRLKQLETQINELKQQNQQLKKDLGLDAKSTPSFAKAAGKEYTLSVGGYIQGQAEFGRSTDARFPNRDEFLVRRARLGARGTFLENFDFKIEGDLGNRDSRSVRMALTDAYINYNKFSWANLKIGQFKAPYSYDELLPDTKVLFVERSLPNEALALGRQVGIGASGGFFDDRLGYSLGMFNGNGKNNQFNDNNQFLYAARIYGTPLKTTWGKQDVRLTLGVDGYYTHDKDGDVDTGFLQLPVDSFDGERRGMSADAQFQLGPFDLQAAYYQAGYTPEGFHTQQVRGWYVAGEYFILPKKLQALVRYESLDTDIENPGHRSNVWDFGLNYYIKGTDLMLKLNYLLGHPADGPRDRGRLMAQVQLVF